MRKYWRALYSLLIAALFAASCAPQPKPRLLSPWSYATLRVIDPAESTREDMDLIAAYTRQIGGEWQVRLDLLEAEPEPNYDLILALDTVPGGRKDLPLDTPAQLDWDILISVPARGTILAKDDKGRPVRGLGIRVLRNPAQSYLTIAFRKEGLEGIQSPFRVQAFLSPASEEKVIDATDPWESDRFPPGQAQVLLAFWDALPAYSPVQALRRWDGAHSGPLGGRHGLSNLERAVAGSGVPFFLLDLKNPISLSALEAVGGTDRTARLARKGLLVLPDPFPGYPGSPSIPDWALSLARQQYQKSARQSDLAPSPFVFSPNGDLPPGISAQVVFRPADSNLSNFQPVFAVRQANRLLLSVPGYVQSGQGAPQLDQAGLTIEARRALVEAALSPGSLLIFGGSLPASAWGDPHAAQAGLQYLTRHPWISVLGAQDLAGLKAVGSGQSQPILNREAPSSPAQAADGVLAYLKDKPDNPLGEAAWQSWLALFSPTWPAPEALPELRAAYLGQVGAILAAARWADSPVAISDCSQDLDDDGQPECVLASQNLFAVVEPGPGYLTYLFANLDGNAHQVLGPSWQFMSGLSDSQGWDIGRGLLADPEAIPGLHVRPDISLPNEGTQAPYRPQIEGRHLLLTSADSMRQIDFHLEGQTLLVQVKTTGHALASIPVDLDPWLRFTPNWYSSYAQSGEGTERTLQAKTPKSPGIRLTVHASTPLTSLAFNDPGMQLTAPENPDREYPPSRYLPFPMQLLQFQVENEGWAILEIEGIGE